MESFFQILFSTYGGVTVVMIGLASFIGKIWLNKTVLFYKEQSDKKINKLKAELQATSQKLQAELDKGIYTHKVQFEKEFSSYQELWKLINNLHGQLGVFIRSVKFNENIESNRQKCKILLYEARTRANELVPFIDKSIEDIIFDTLDIYSNIHLSTCAYLDGNKTEDLEQLKAQEGFSKETIMELYDNSYNKTCKHKLYLLAVEIRNRLSKLNIV